MILPVAAILKILKVVTLLVPAAAGANVTGLANVMGLAKNKVVGANKGERPWFASRRFISLVVGFLTAAWAGHTGVEIPAEGAKVIEVAADNIIVSIGAIWTAYLQIVGQIRKKRKNAPGLAMVLVMLLPLCLGGMGGCATFKGVSQMTPQEAHSEAGEAFKMASVTIGMLYVTDIIDQEQFAALEGMLEQANELHALVGEAIVAVETAGESDSAAAVMVAYQAAYLKSKAVLDDLSDLLRELRR